LPETLDCLKKYGQRRAIFFAQARHPFRRSDGMLPHVTFAIAEDFVIHADDDMPWSATAVRMRTFMASCHFRLSKLQTVFESLRLVAEELHNLKDGFLHTQ